MDNQQQPSNDSEDSSAKKDKAEEPTLDVWNNDESAQNRNPTVPSGSSVHNSITSASLYEALRSGKAILKGAKGQRDTARCASSNQIVSQSSTHRQSTLEDTKFGHVLSRRGTESCEQERSDTSLGDDSSNRNGKPIVKGEKNQRDTARDASSNRNASYSSTRRQSTLEDTKFRHVLSHRRTESCEQERSGTSFDDDSSGRISLRKSALEGTKYHRVTSRGATGSPDSSLRSTPSASSLLNDSSRGTVRLEHADDRELLARRASELDMNGVLVINSEMTYDEPGAFAIAEYETETSRHLSATPTGTRAADMNGGVLVNSEMAYDEPGAYAIDEYETETSRHLVSTPPGTRAADGQESIALEVFPLVSDDDIPGNHSNFFLPEAQAVSDIEIAELHAPKWYNRKFYRLLLVGGIFFASSLLVTIVVLLVKQAVNASSAPTPTMVSNPPTPNPTLSPSPSAAPTLTPEQIACNFIGIPHLEACRRVDYVSFANGFASGMTLPSEIGLLTSVSNLDLSGSGLAGSIPVSIGRLTNLNNLNFSNNALEGSIPSSIGRLTNLHYLDLSFNRLTGSIPQSIGTFPLLIWLSFQSNQISGTIPASVGQLSSLKYLFFGSNDLTGSIPSSIGDLIWLDSLEFIQNQLWGTIPSSLGKLTRLASLYLGYNVLTGNIPSSFGHLTLLSTINLAANDLTGTFPSWITNLTMLVDLNFFNNTLSGTIPPSIGNLAMLEELALAHNDLTGSFPSSIGKMAQLTYLSLEETGLTGSIPSSVCTNAIFLLVDCDKMECSCCTILIDNTCGLSLGVGR